MISETGDVEQPKSTTCGRPRKLHFDNITYMTALINHPDWFLDELLGLLNTNWFISIHFTTIYRELEHAGVLSKTCDRLLRNMMRTCMPTSLRQWVNTNLRKSAFSTSFQRMSIHSTGTMVRPRRGNVMVKHEQR